MCEPAGYDPIALSSDESTPELQLPAVVLARLAARASELASERSFLPFIPHQARVPV